MTLPSKKIIYLATAGVLIVVLIFVFKNYDFHGGGFSNKGLSYEAATSTPDQDTGIDSDGDGLTDWQEINIWHTDPNNPDTDNDGTPDGTEVSTGRDPAKTGPNDALQPGDPRTVAAIKAEISSDNSANSNITENLSKNFFTNYLSAQSGSGGIDASTQGQVIQNSLGSLNIPALTKKYTLSSLSIIDPTPAQIKAFGNNVASIEKKNLTSVLGNNKSNPEAFGALIIAYQNNARDLSTVSVPREIAPTLLEIINYDNQLAVSLNDIQNYSVDPVKALLAIKTYQAIEVAEPTLYKNIALYFKNNGIIFGNSDSGYVWNNYNSQTTQ